MTQRILDSQLSPIDLNGISPHLLTGLTKPVLRHTLAEMLDPARSDDGLEAGFNNKIC